MKRFTASVLCACACACALAAPIPWKTPTYTLVARDMNLRTALDTFAVAEGIPLVMSEGVQGVFSGDFKDVPSGEFLDRLATVHNLTWYYDGAALYLYGAGEVRTMLLDLQYMKAGEVRDMLAELGVEDSRFPLKTTSDDQIIMVAGPARYVSLIAELVARADKMREKRTFNEVEVRLFPLINTWADDVSFSVSSPETVATIRGVAHILAEMMASGASATNSRDVGMTNVLDTADARYEDALSASFRPVIRPENRLNAVLVRDVTSRMEMYERIIKKLDVPQKLVEIAVTVIELSKKDALDWQLSLKASGSHREMSGTAGQNAGNLFDEASLGGKGLAGALSYLGKEVQVSASLTALKEKGKARSISRTSLLTVNNLAAQMRDSQSYHVRVIGTEVANLSEVSAGTTLQIKPRIVAAPSTNVANQVWLSLRLEDGGFESIAVDSMPMTRSSTLQTQTAVFEDESIMLAGYLRDIEESGGWGIPYLRDIPWIGWIFGGASVKKETVQRMFIISPHIVDLDAEMLARLQSTRLRDIEEAEQMEDDADASDGERRRRDLERDDARRRREERDDDLYERRKAEIRHIQELRKLDRRRKQRYLSEEIKAWREIERAERERLEAEAQAAAAAEFAEEESKKEGKTEE
ncbi:MAG: type III secretion system outer membrane ring subunit SctC [Kiritimatiellae bacterium]|nr:type III secretion system outer membrane ring subunit SctC [Kiritimatiellia bacterium]